VKIFGKGKKMKISEMINALNEIYKKHGDLQIVYSSDEEGNFFGTVGFTPTVGVYEQHDFMDEEYLKEEYGDEEYTINSVCIN